MNKVKVVRRRRMAGLERTEKIADLRRELRSRLRNLWVCMAKSWASKVRPKNQSSLIIREGGV